MDPKISASIGLIEKRIFALRKENAERLRRLEKVDVEIEKLLAVRSSLNTLGDVANDSSCHYYQDVIEDLVKSRYA